MNIYETFVGSSKNLVRSRVVDHFERRMKSGIDNFRKHEECENILILTNEDGESPSWQLPIIMENIVGRPSIIDGRNFFRDNGRLKEPMGFRVVTNIAVLDRLWQENRSVFRSPLESVCGIYAEWVVGRLATSYRLDALQQQQAKVVMASLYFSYVSENPERDFSGDEGEMFLMRSLERRFGMPRTIIKDVIDSDQDGLGLLNVCSESEKRRLELALLFLSGLLELPGVPLSPAQLTRICTQGMWIGFMYNELPAIALDYPPALFSMIAVANEYNLHKTGLGNILRVHARRVGVDRLQDWITNLYKV